MELVASAFVALRSVPDGELPEPAGEAKDELGLALSRQPHFSKTEAAALLGVSLPTLDKWVRMGLLPVQRVPEFKRDRIPTVPLVELATEIKKLRSEGRERGLLDEALSRLEQEDPDWRKEFDELYGPAFAAAEADDELVSAAPGPNWHPDD